MGRTSIKKSVAMLTPAIEKYALGRLLQPLGNVGLHALEILCGHSKALTNTTTTVYVATIAAINQTDILKAFCENIL